MFPLPLWAVYILGIAGILCTAFLGLTAARWALTPAPPTEYQRQQMRKRYEQPVWAEWKPEMVEHLRRN